MNCLCCGKPLKENLSEEESGFGWHRKCIKDFFGTRDLPELDITEDTIQRIAFESIRAGYTVPGVQKKLSLHLFSGNTSEAPRLTLVNYPTGYILKPQTEEFRSLPEAEYLIMDMARTIGIRTVPFALIPAGKDRKSYAYITKRIDRVHMGEETIQMMAMEDFCQLDGRMTEDKYRGSYERCAKIVSRYSSRMGLDLSELFLRIVFSFIIGNSDMHLKNFSLIETAPGSQKYILSEAYDLLPVQIIMPEDTEDLALTLNGKKKKLRKKDFLLFAEKSGISGKTAERLINSIIRKGDLLLNMCGNSFLPEEMKQSLEKLIQERCAVLK